MIGFKIMKIISWLFCCIMRIGVNVDVIGGGNKPIDGARVWELGDCCGNKQSVRRKEEENEAQ